MPPLRDAAHASDVARALHDAMQPQPLPPREDSMAAPATTNDDAEEGADAEPTKGGRKGLIIGVVLLLVLGAGGFAAFKMMDHKQDPKKKDSPKKEQLLP